jgi:hypothetical protein
MPVYRRIRFFRNNLKNHLRMLYSRFREARDTKGVKQMDPTANLKKQRELIEKFRSITEGEGSTDDFTGDCYRVVCLTEDLTVLIEALDGWISKGGFLPEQWRR